MTPLRKPVYRETQTRVRDCSKRRLLVAGLLPGDILELRLKGTRQRFVLTVEEAYYHAARLKALKLRQERAARRTK
jgi:hypothetical protein